MSAADLIIAVSAWWMGACPFCPPSSPPLAEQLAEADVAALVQWSRTYPAAAEFKEPDTEFIVLDALRTKDDRPRRKESIRVPYLLSGEPGDQFVMLGKQGEVGVDWSLPIAVNEVSYGYLKQAPAPERPATERLAYFLKYLEHPEVTIANDAFAEFSRARYADVVAIRDQLSARQVRRWIAELEPQEQLRLGFYGFLLGLCGGPDDADYLAREIFRPTRPDETRLGLDGQMGGYVILKGDMGLAELIAAKLERPDQPDGDVYALINTLRFLEQYPQADVSRERVLMAMELLLDRSAFAEVVLGDLARWEHWRVMERVAAMDRKPPFDDPSSRQKLIHFALACVKAADKTPEKPVPEADIARRFLADLERTDPETLRNAKRFFSGRVLPLPMPE